MCSKMKRICRICAEGMTLPPQVKICSHLWMKWIAKLQLIHFHSRPLDRNLIRTVFFFDYNFVISSWILEVHFYLRKWILCGLVNNVRRIGCPMFKGTFMICYSSNVNWIYLDRMLKLLSQQKCQLTLSPFESLCNL